MDNLCENFNCLETSIYNLKSAYNLYEVIMYVYEDDFFNFSIDNRETSFSRLFCLFNNIFLSEIEHIEESFIQLFKNYRAVNKNKEIQEPDTNKRLQEFAEKYLYDIYNSTLKVEGKEAEANKIYELYTKVKTNGTNNHIDDLKAFNDKMFNMINNCLGDTIYLNEMLRNNC